MRHGQIAEGSNTPANLRIVQSRHLGNFLRTMATPEPIKDWSMTILKERLIKIGAKVVSHGRYVAFQMAEVAISRHLFRDILRLIAELRPPPEPAPGGSVRLSRVRGQPMGEVRRDDGKRNMFWPRRGVGPPRRPSTMRG